MKRKKIYHQYYQGLIDLEEKGMLRLPIVNEYADHNAHMFYVLLNSEHVRDELMYFLKKHGVLAVFHYIPLHTASFAQKHYDPVTLPVTEEYSKRLLRLPMFFGLSTNDQQKVIDLIHRYFDKETE
jgi:dTDP-4-amino-4,6-dideoxygalactose transaminase